MFWLLDNPGCWVTQCVGVAPSIGPPPTQLVARGLCRGVSAVVIQCYSVIVLVFRLFFGKVAAQCALVLVAPCCTKQGSVENNCFLLIELAFSRNFHDEWIFYKGSFLNACVFANYIFPSYHTYVAHCFRCLHLKHSCNTIFYDYFVSPLFYCVQCCGAAPFWYARHAGLKYVSLELRSHL